jgi:RNA polymerase-binding protein DksA
MLLPKRVRSAPQLPAVTSLTPEFILRQRTLLEAQRDQIRQQVRSLHLQAGHLQPQICADLLDQAQGDAPEEVLFVLGELDRHRLRGVEDALQRLEQGHYGVCSECHRPIGDARLAALPATALCVGCQEVSELEAEFSARGVPRPFSREAWSLLGAIS